jgi:hypothetical protein
LCRSVSLSIHCDKRKEKIGCLLAQAVVVLFYGSRARETAALWLPALPGLAVLRPVVRRSLNGPVSEYIRRRQGRDNFRFPLNHLGIRARLALRKYFLYQLDAALNLLVRHLLNASAVLDFHFPRHQQDKQFQKYRRLVPHHLLYRLAAAATEGGVHFPDGVGVKRMTRAMAWGISVRPPTPFDERYGQW